MGILFWLTGCAALDRPPCVVLAEQLQYCLQPPARAGNFTASQQVDVLWKHRKEVTLAELENEGEVFTMAVLSPMGQKLLQLKQVGNRVESLGGLASGFDTSVILALIQLALWPADDVVLGLGGEFTWFADHTHRYLESSGKVLMQSFVEGALPTPEVLLMRLPEHHLELTIRTLKERE